MTEKAIGYLLLALGIIIIFFSAISVWGVFTKQTRPVELFTLKGISLDMSQMLAGSLPPEYASVAQQLAKSAPKQEIISAEILNQTSNLFAHLMFMGFLASIGAKLATIGTQFIRPIVVKLKAKEVTTEPS